MAFYISAMRRTAVAVFFIIWLGKTAFGGDLDLEVVLPEASVQLQRQNFRDAFVCTQLELPEKSYKLIGVEPVIQSENVTQVLMYGCDVPFSKPEHGEQATWDCRQSSVCGGASETIMYGWARNATELDLPRGVGFSVGRGSAVTWVVLQVHYAAAPTAADRTGVRLHLQDTPVPYSAGVLSYTSNVKLPKHRKHWLETRTCCYRGFQPLTTFAVRVRTHEVGQSVLMGKLQPGQKAHKHVVAAGNPQKPHGFNPVASEVIWPGDHLAVTCSYDSREQRPIHDHELCNMHLMVYSTLPHVEMCTDGSSVVDERAAGNMQRGARLLPDPFPLWRPVKPTDNIGNGSTLGAVASVAMSPTGQLWALHRGGRIWGNHSFDDSNKMLSKGAIPHDVVVQLHPDTGKVLRQWGADQFMMPHMITVDHNNSVWVVDAGRHQVLKYTASGRSILQVGKKDKPGSTRFQLCQPTQVAVLNDGGFLVADGYCNSRIMRYFPNGTYHSQYQLPDIRGRVNLKTNPGGMGIGVAHSLVVDECDAEIMLADKEQARVYVFDLHTQLLKQTIMLSQYGKLYALTKGPYGRTIALAWRYGSPAVLVDVTQPQFMWQLPNSTALWPHDFALGPAALSLTGAGDRLLAVYVAPLCETCGPLKKYILFPKTFDAPDQDTPLPQLVPSTDQPLLAHMHSAGHHPAEQAQEAAAARAAVGLDTVVHISKAEEQLDVQDDSAAEQQEADEDEQEMQQMADPHLVQELQQKLQQLQQQLKEYEADASIDSDEFIVIHTAGLHISSRHAFAGAMVMISVGLLIGVTFVLHMLSTPPKAGWAAQQQGISLPQSKRGETVHVLAGGSNAFLGDKTGVVNECKSL